MIVNQAYLFLIFILVGTTIGLVFDFFRILRRSFKISDIFTYIQDIIFWLITGLIILISIFIFNNGEIRFFMFVGLLIGIIFYLLLFSKYIIKISVNIINFIKDLVIKIFNILKLPFIFIYNFLKNTLFRPFRCIIINLSSKIKKLQQISTKIKEKNMKKCKKGVKN